MEFNHFEFAGHISSRRIEINAVNSTACHFVLPFTDEVCYIIATIRNDAKAPHPDWQQSGAVASFLLQCSETAGSWRALGASRTKVN